MQTHVFTRRAVVAVTFALFLLVPAPASRADLPRTYQVQRVDSPAPVTDGNFGMSLANVGDVDGDGRDDLLTGTDKHGTRVGQVFVISGADGSTIRAYQLPDTDPGSPPGPPGDRRSGFGAAVSKLADLASCPGFSGTAGEPCALAALGGADGVPEHLVSASGVDVDADGDDLGVVYVFDGASGALLKRLRMPAGDRSDQIASSGNDPRFGRTLLSPAGLPPCDQNGDEPFGGPGIAACPPVGLPSGTAQPYAQPEAVRAGDVDGDGYPDVLVGATDYDETKATAHPDSDCATQAGSEPCGGAGRVYLYSGGDIQGSDPVAALESATIVKNPLSQADDPTPPSAFSNDEAFGILLIPVGDAGKCSDATVTQPGDFCAAASAAQDEGRPDFAIAANAVDLFGYTDVGEVLLMDGAKLSVIKDTEYPDPRIDPAWGITQNGVVYPALGDLAGTTLPDFYVPDIQWSGDHEAQGRGLVVNGDPRTSGSFREFPALFVDPTPQGSEQFGASAASLGNVAGDVRSEVLVGAIGPHNPGQNPGIVNDVHIFDPTTETALQSIRAPDAQGGEAFGAALQPLGDVNGDGFVDFAVGAGFYDLGSTGSAGRVYIFRSDDSPAPAAAAPVAPSSQVVSLAGREIEIEARPARVRARRTVKFAGLLEAFANEQACERDQRVEVQRRRPGSLRYRTFARAQTSQGGTFTVRTKPATTYVYRARVARGDACQGAVSNRERVSVVKRKRR